MKEIEIRAFEAKDAPQVAALDQERFLLSPYHEKTFLDSLSLLRQKILLVSSSKEVLAYLFYGWVEDEAEIYRLAVKKKDEGKGYATALLEEGERLLVEEGVKTIYLEVRKSNLRAQKLYAKEGYIFYRERKAYYDNGEDAYCLKKGLE
jgi:ribosomal-protein-alanine N-acetyltransferase